MSDRLAEEVGDVMREQDGSIERELEQYAAGALAPEARAALEAKAAKDPSVARALELYAPISREVVERIVHANLQKAATPPKTEGARVIPLYTRRVVQVALAAAAVLLFVLFGVGRPGAPLPAYDLEARVQDAAFRGEEVRQASARADSTVELVLVPKTPVEGEVEGRLFVLDGGRVRKVDLAPEISPDGALRWRATAERVAGVTTGTVTVVLVAGRKGHLPAEPPAAGTEAPGWRATRVELVVRPAP